METKHLPDHVYGISLCLLWKILSAKCSLCKSGHTLHFSFSHSANIVFLVRGMIERNRIRLSFDLGRLETKAQPINHRGAIFHRTLCRGQRWDQLANLPKAFYKHVKRPTLASFECSANGPATESLTSICTLQWTPHCGGWRGASSYIRMRHAAPPRVPRGDRETALPFSQDRFAFRGTPIMSHQDIYVLLNYKYVLWIICNMFLDWSSESLEFRGREWCIVKGMTLVNKKFNLWYKMGPIFRLVFFRTIGMTIFFPWTVWI